MELGKEWPKGQCRQLQRGKEKVDFAFKGCRTRRGWGGITALALWCIAPSDRALEPAGVVKMAKLPSKAVGGGDPGLCGHTRLQLSKGVDLPVH